MVNSASMDPSALTEINEEILLATLQGFAKHGFSGDLEFRFEGRQILRTVCEIHVAETAELPDQALQSVDRNWPRIKNWAEKPETLLQVLYQKGKITRV